MTGATPELLYSTPHGSLRRTKFHVKWISAALIVGLRFFACPEPASAQEIYCPESISVEQTVATIPEGWTVRQDEAASTLEGITFYSGPPEEKASLVYDQWTKRNGLAYGVWRFQPKSSHPIWLSCRYSSTRVLLAKQLPAETSECTVAYDPKVTVSGSLEIRKIDCH
jgi:hypothetical protein